MYNNIYIKNIGKTKTLIHNSDTNKNKMNEIAWNADYDGENANIYLNTNTNGKKHKYDVKLDNEDLANILNIPSVNMPIDKRLELYFTNKQPNMYQVELPYKTNLLNNLSIKTPTLEGDTFEIRQLDNSIKENIYKCKRRTYKKHKKCRKRKNCSKKTKK